MNGHFRDTHYDIYCNDCGETTWVRHGEEAPPECPFCKIKREIEQEQREWVEHMLTKNGVNEDF